VAGFSLVVVTLKRFNVDGNIYLMLLQYGTLVCAVAYKYETNC